MDSVQKIFISYAREDEEFCRHLAHALKHEGFSIWMDVESIRAGVEWAKNISDAIYHSDALIAVHSSASLARSYQAKGEWIHAHDLGKAVYPIIIEAGIRPHQMFAHIQAMDFSRPGTFEEHFQKLAEALRSGSTGSQIQGKYRFEFGDKTAFYPDFVDGFAKNYTDLINHATDIYCMAGIGHRFIAQHDGALMRRLSSGAKLYLLIARHTECNLRTIASWSSAESPNTPYLYDRLQRQVRHTAETLLRITSYVAQNQIELKLLDFPAPFTTFQFDSQKPNGTIVVNLYPLGPSIQAFFRPSTTLQKYIFPDLYDHFRLSFTNAWQSAESISTKDYIQYVLANE